MQELDKENLTILEELTQLLAECNFRICFLFLFILWLNCEISLSSPDRGMPSINFSFPVIFNTQKQRFKAVPLQMIYFMNTFGYRVCFTNGLLVHQDNISTLTFRDCDKKCRQRCKIHVAHKQCAHFIVENCYDCFMTAFCVTVHSRCAGSICLFIVNRNKILTFQQNLFSSMVCIIVS